MGALLGNGLLCGLGRCLAHFTPQHRRQGASDDGTYQNSAETTHSGVSGKTPSVAVKAHRCLLLR
jgi:hypothetical protein